MLFPEAKGRRQSPLFGPLSGASLVSVVQSSDLRNRYHAPPF